MTNQWDSELTEEKLQAQIVSAKSKYQELKFELSGVEYRDGYIWVYFSQGKNANFNFSVTGVKCLEVLTEEQLIKVELLGTRAIRWEEQNIDLGLEEILLAGQMIQNWLDNLR